MTTAAARYSHATAIVVNERGVLIRGPSGAGKSRLAALLVAEARRRNWFAALIGDDRVALTVLGAHLVARGHPAVAGLVERRGEGLTALQTEPACLIHCVIDLSPASSERLPEPQEAVTEVLGVRLYRVSEEAGLQSVDVVRLLDRISASAAPAA